MKQHILSVVLRDVLSYYLCLDEEALAEHLSEPSTGTKERVATLDDLQVVIYSNDHNPPHFHVKSNDLNIDAKFKIEDCELISGLVDRKILKRVKAFHSSPKGKIVMEMIWNKRN